LLCEQYYDFAEELADQYLVMERGEVIASGPGPEMKDKGIRKLVSI
jgi:urea transport system ATP-binding protein